MSELKQIALIAPVSVTNSDGRTLSGKSFSCLLTGANRQRRNSNQWRRTPVRRSAGRDQTANARNGRSKSGSRSGAL